MQEHHAPPWSPGREPLVLTAQHTVPPIPDPETLWEKLRETEETGPARPGTPLAAPPWNPAQRLQCTLAALQNRGWTDRTIRILLGEPDATAPNPHGRSAPPMKLYTVERVREAEQDPRFIQAINGREQRQAAGRRAVETRRKSAVRWAAETPILLECPTGSLDELAQMAVERRNGFLLQQEWHPGNELLELLPDHRRLDPDTVARLCTNLLRHECSDYDEALAMNFGRTGSQLAVNIIRLRIHREIARWWPGLSDECWKKILESGMEEDFP